MTQRGDELIHNRRANLAALRARGIDPYPARYRPTQTTRRALARLARAEARGAGARTSATVAGRIARIRGMGRATFVDIEDSEGRLQLFVRANALGGDYALLEHLDLGDFVGARGTMMRTRAGEPSLEAASLRLLAKAVRPPPDDYYGLKDVEQRYRQRYLDLIANRGVHDAMRARSRIIAAVRRFFDARGYLEVETPCSCPCPRARWPSPLRRATTRSTARCICASPRSSTSSASSSAGWTASTR